MNDKDVDLRIPMSLSSSLNLNYCIYDCQKTITSEFENIYKQNTDTAHVDDWGKIAFGMSRTYPQHKVAIKGNCSEIGRCYYYHNGRHKKNITQKDLLRLEKGWEKLKIASDEIKKWYDLIKVDKFNYDIYDLFYWENRMGSWQAQSQLEWDIVQEVFSPFNSRELLDLMLSIDSSKRKLDNPDLYQKAMKFLWDEVLIEPINPPSMKKRAKNQLAGILATLGFLEITKKILHK
jgi:hypothetical protein